MAKKSKVQFVCQNCGYVSPKFLGRCPNCGKWNTMVEEIEQDTTDRRTRTSLTGEKAKPTKSQTSSLKRTSDQNKIRRTEPCVRRRCGARVYGLDWWRSRYREIHFAVTSFSAISSHRRKSLICIRRRKRRADKITRGTPRKYQHRILSIR